MPKSTLLTEYTKNFKTQTAINSKGIGIECEFPVVDRAGNAISLEIIHQLFDYLEKEGFEIKVDVYTNQPIAATRVNLESALQFDYCEDTITTDLGFSTLEIALAPQPNLWKVQAQLNELLSILLLYFNQHQCRILGYGIQPITPPSKDLLAPQKRYNFKNRVSGNELVPKSVGKDFHLLTVSASNQCHIEVSKEDAIVAFNVLNGLSGLQIALQANSAIWKGAVDANFKAIRELFWDYCFSDRLNQAGIPPKFSSFEDYMENLMHFKAQRVIRDGKPYRINSPNTFGEFYHNIKPTVGESREGECLLIKPAPKDIHLQNGFCYYNARLVSKFGTIENRMACQQPPGESMVTAALTLGILENLKAAQTLMEALYFISPKTLRIEAIKDALAANFAEKSIIPWLYELLVIAEKGLQKRGLGEEIFLAPLFKRLKEQQSPADLAIAIFQKEGIEAFLDKFSFTRAKISNYLRPINSNLEIAEIT